MKISPVLEFGRATNEVYMVFTNLGLILNDNFRRFYLFIFSLVSNSITVPYDGCVELLEFLLKPDTCCYYSLS